MKFLSIANAIKLMVIIGVLAAFSVVVQSCQSPKDDGIIRVSEKKLEIAQFNSGSLQKLHALEAPPGQPATKFIDGSGNSMVLSDFHGRYVLLNVWATWCPPCVVEMPSLNTLAYKFRKENFTVLTVSMDNTDSAVDDFFSKNDLSALTRWRDPNLNLAAKLEVRGLPITVLYDRQGNEIARVSGEADWASAEAEALIREILGK